MSDAAPLRVGERESALPTIVLGLLVVVVTAFVYLRTLMPSVPFWDAGEFIAVSNILGIPHPPGTPFYVLLGRVATLVPIGSIAQRVNGMSALASLLAVLFTYLTTLRLIRIAQRGGMVAAPAAAERAAPAAEPLVPPGFLATLRSEWLAQVGAVAAAFLLAFSNNFWDNATGAETYSEMSLAQILILWLALRWWEAHRTRPTLGPLLLCVYVMWLSVGLMLGVGMMGLPLLVLLFVVDRKVFLLFLMPMASVLAVTFGLEKMVGVVLVLSIVVFWAYVRERKLSGWLALAATAGAVYGSYFAFGPAAFTPVAAIVSAASIVVPVVVLALRHREGRILALGLCLMLVGYSTHTYLPIRAAQHPAINEGNPSTWPALKALLEREQYGKTNMFVRRGTGENQLDKEFWRYWKRQWPLVSTLRTVEGVPVQEEPRLWVVLLPLLLGVAGMVWQARRDGIGPLVLAAGLGVVMSVLLSLLRFDGGGGLARLVAHVLVPLATLVLLIVLFASAGGRRQWAEFRAALAGLEGRESAASLTVLTLFLFSTAGLILFLNFSDHEVRDRDYFFTTGYHVYAIWMGLGIVWLVRWIRDSFSPGMLRGAATAAAAVLLALQPFVILRNLWFVEDGSRNYVAHDYAWNMLAPLAPNSFVFTNGDNDTFPLWYMQEVENFRQDVKVVNLSLLNTDWYIYQLRDEEPKVPVDLPDQAIRILGAGGFEDSTGRIIYTNEFMVRHILEVDKQGASGWIKQPYYAVTVPEHYGFDPYFTFEGLVSRVNRDTLQGPVDEEKTRYNLYQRFQYRGLFNTDGTWDTTVYKDENAITLSRNYAAAHLQLALDEHARGKLDEAIAEMQRVQHLFPDYPEAIVPLADFYVEKGEMGRALALFRELSRRAPDNPELHYRYGLALLLTNDLPGALRELDETIRLYPAFPRPYYLAYQALDQAGQHERALGYMRRLLEANPQDPQARRLLQLAPEPKYAPLPAPPPTLP